MFSEGLKKTNELFSDLIQPSYVAQKDGYLFVNPPQDHQAPIWLKSLLEDVGFGILILDRELNVRFCNRSARTALVLSGFEFTSRLNPESGQRLERLMDTKTCPDVSKFFSTAKLGLKGERKLILLGVSENRIALALSPINLGEQLGQDGVLVTLERETLCEAISLWAYGRVQGLTAGELKVLELLANCHEPQEVAANLKVSLSTVRSHIRSMICKTESSSLRDLLLRVSKLPPIRALGCAIE